MMNQYKTPGLPKRERRTVDGLLLLDKPTGMTSNAILQRVKRLCRARKAGHTGSLDPLASGMLPLCFGQGTKVSAYLLDADKTYRVTARFGTQTDTADADGTVIAESPLRQIERNALERALSKLTGDIEQVPPMYSALKKDGKRLYELARQGIEVERPPRPVTIYSLDIEAFDPGAPVLRIRCSKGTYVRTLVEDLAELLGTVGHVAALRRLSVRPFEEKQLVTIEQVEAAVEAGDEAFARLLLPVDSALVAFPSIGLDSEQSGAVRQGKSVQVVAPPVSGFCRIYDEQAKFVGIGEAFAGGQIAPKRLFVTPGEVAG